MGNKQRKPKVTDEVRLLIVLRLSRILLRGQSVRNQDMKSASNYPHFTPSFSLLQVKLKTSFKVNMNSYYYVNLLPVEVKLWMITQTMLGLLALPAFIIYYKNRVVRYTSNLTDATNTTAFIYHHFFYCFFDQYTIFNLFDLVD